jgi:uncharacterized surface protein with fasciclin (FAS1) repeats
MTDGRERFVHMKRLAIALFLALAASSTLAAEEIRFYGKSVMFSTNTITGNIMESREHTMLMKAMRSVGLEFSLWEPGSYTLFAPDDAAFARLPASYSEEIFQRRNRDEMAKLLACHLVVGTDLAGLRLKQSLKAGQPLKIRTLGGCVLTVRIVDGAMQVIDEKGGVANVVIDDVLQQNGMIQIIDHVLIPSS